MGKIDDLNAEVAGLQADIDTLQAAVAAQDSAQDATIASLQALVDQPEAATNEQIQAVIDAVVAARADVKGTLPPAEPPV
jgi:uncharacterized coiled-coil protein SlyX